MEILSSRYWKSSFCDNSIIYSIYFHVKYTDLTKFNVCRFFTSFLLFSVSLFFSFLTSSFLSLLRSDPYTKALHVFDLTPYLVQSPGASELMNFSRLLGSSLYLRHVGRIPQHDWDREQVSTCLTKRVSEHSKFIRQCMGILFSPQSLSFQDP